MKKMLLTIAGLLALSMAFISCGGTPATDDGGEEDLTGVKVIECEKYDNFLTVTSVPAASGYTKVNFEAKWGDSATGIQAAAQLMYSDEGNQLSQASASAAIQKEYKTATAACLDGAEYSKWENGASVNVACEDKANRVQFYIQDSSYAATSGKIYVKKVWLTGEGKEDLVIFDASKEDLTK